MGEKYFKSIFTGVTSSSDMHVHPGNGEEGRLTKVQRRQIKLCQPLQYTRRFRALQRHEAPPIQHLHLDRTLARLHPLVQLFSEQREILISPAGVGDDVEGVCGMLGDDGIVDNAPFVIQQHGERASSFGQALEVGRGEGLEEGSGCRASEVRLDHVGHVEQAG